MDSEISRTASPIADSRDRSARRGRLVFSSLAQLLVLLLQVGCDECRTWADCTGEGFQACVEGQCEEVSIDEGESCEVPSDCGDGAWACTDAHCARMPTCQKLVGDMVYAARCDGSATPQTGIARASSVGCASNIAASDAFAFDIPIETIPVVDGLLVDGLDTNGICFAASWSALDSTMLLNGCSLGATTCDVVVRAKTREGLPCIPATVGACADGQTCTAIPSLVGAGVCR